MAILLIIHECFRNRPSLGQRKLQVSENIFVEPSLEATEKEKKKRKRSIHFFRSKFTRLKITMLFYRRIKIFTVYASINFKDLEGRSTQTSDLLLYEDDPFPTLFASSFSIYLTHPSTGIAYARYKVSSQERELHSRIYVYTFRFFSWILFTYIRCIPINLFRKRIFHLKVLFN